MRGCAGRNICRMRWPTRATTKMNSPASRSFRSNAGTRSCITFLRSRMQPEKSDVMLLCGRAALNFAYTLGVPSASCPMQEERRLPLFRSIGFSPDGGKMTADLKKIFSGHCC